MDEDELKLAEDYNTLISSKDFGFALDIPKPGWDEGEFFRQRKWHRTVLFLFAILASTASLVYLGILIAVQSKIRIAGNSTFEIINSRGLQILAVSVFGQIFGVIYVIANAVWSNDEFRLLEKK